MFYNTLKRNHIILYHIWYQLHDEPTVLYISEYSQYWFQHAALNLITTRREFTLFQYYKTLSSISTSFCIIFNICYMMNQQYYIYSRILLVLFQHAALNLITTKREFTLLQYSTTLSSIIASFSIIFDICYMMNQQYYIYSRILQVLFQQTALYLITTRREFTLFQYYKTLSSIITSFCIIFNICYMMNQQYYIYSRILLVLFQHAALNLITTKREFTLSQYSTTLSSIIASFCIIFDICYMMNQQYYIYYRNSQYRYQHAVLNLITTRREFTLLQYSKTLSSIIASFCIIFNICYMMNQQYYIYSRILQVLFQHAALNLITTRREFTLLQCSTTLSSGITPFFIIFDISYMMNQQYYIYARILPVLISTCCTEFNSTRREFTLFQYYKTLSSIITSFCIIFNICYMMNQ